MVLNVDPDVAIAQGLFGKVFQSIGDLLCILASVTGWIEFLFIIYLLLCLDGYIMCT